MPVAKEGGMRFIVNIFRFCFAVLSGANAASATVEALPVECPEGRLWVTAGGRIPATGRPIPAILTGESGLPGNALLNDFKTVTIAPQARRLVLSPL